MPFERPAQRFRYRRPAVTAVVVLLVFVPLDQFDWALFSALAAETEGTARVAAIAALRYAPQILAVFAVAAWLFGRAAVWDALGMRHRPWRAILLGLSMTVIMPLVFATAPGAAPPGDPVTALIGRALLPSVAEEIFYRAFLFGFLFRFARWGFLPAALLVAALFGAAHLYQGSAPAEAAAIFGITALGSLWFAWLYAEWEFDIWVPASLHVLMNFWWELFSVGDTALGPVGANLARLVVIAMSIVITLMHAKRRGGRAVKGHAWLWGGP